MAAKNPSKPLKIKSVKAHGYTPAYEARLIRGIRKARKEKRKPTRQSARGHKVAEHIERKQKEIERNKISSSQIKSIKSFLRRFNSPLYKDLPTEEDLVDFVRTDGYSFFVQYRTTWDKARKKYLKELRDKSYVNQGWPYLMTLQDSAGAPVPQWLYYH